MLHTNLDHILSEAEFHETLAKNKNVMVCCGRMGPMCLPVYEVMRQLRGEFSQVAFRDLEFDAPHAHLIKELPECRNFRGLPFTVYFRDGNVVHATSSIQTKEQVKEVLEQQFAS